MSDHSRLGAATLDLATLRAQERDPENLTGRVRTVLATHGRVLLRAAHLDRPALLDLLRALADDTAPATAVLSRRPQSETSATPAPAVTPPVATGSPALPLHRDGALVGRPTRLVAFSVPVAAPGVGLLETVDSATAFAEFDPRLASTLRRSTWEYLVSDRRPFPHLPDDWFTRATFVEDTSHATTALNLVLPSRPGEEAMPWRTRARGLDEDASRSLVAAVDDGLRASSTFDVHAWRPGDVVVLDNARVMHGITAVTAGAPHLVLRASV